MSERISRLRRTRRARTVDEVTEPEEVAEEPKAEETPTRRSRRSRTESTPLPEERSVEDESGGSEDESEPVAPTPRKRIVRVRNVPKEPEDDEDLPFEPAEPEEIDKTVRSNLPQTLNMALEGQLVLDMLAAMREGESYVIARMDSDSWRIAISKEAAMVKPRKQLKGKAYEREVYTEEFFNHEREWGKLSTEEKWQRIQESGVEWEEADNDRVNMMRATKAYRDSLDMEKYKPQYQKRAARGIIRAD